MAKKKKDKKRKKLNTRQKKLVRIISDNISNRGFTKSMTQMLKEAGYEESTARQQAEVLSRIEDELDPLITSLEKERNRALKQLTKKITKAKYRDLVDAIDKFTKVIQLLSGKPTERVGLSLKELFKSDAD